MAAKYLYSLTDENPDLQKQIGCMTGVFQLFNRSHIVTRRPKRVRPGRSQFNNGTPERESSSIYRRPAIVEKHSNKNIREDHGNCNINRTTHRELDWSSPDHQSLDLRDVVKDSMNREARRLSPKATTNGPHGVVDYRDPHNTLSKFEESNWYHDDPNELSRSKSFHFKDDSPFSISKDYPRFSLDNQERSISSVPFKLSDSKSRNPKRDNTIENGLIHTQPPSVVAKLMGLETFHDSASTNYEKLPIEEFDLLSKFSKSDFRGSIKIPDSSTSLCWKNHDMKRISRAPIEPARRTTHNPVTSVYDEVDKRLKNLEFNQSGKDLRALKRVLEAMQSVEARKNERLMDNQNSRSNISRAYESPIVIMKPANLVEKGFTNNNPTTENTHARNQEKTNLLVKEGESGGPEYPSPVSVLDDSIYREDLPSPVKNTLNSQKDDLTQNPNEKSVKDQHKPTNDVSNTTISRVSSRINREKLQNIEHLVQKLKRFNSTHNEAHTDYIAFLCENTNPDDKYISEILLASGILLRDLSSFEFHSSIHPINPQLFFVLEQTKFRDLQKGKFHRKLIFDAINEILVGRLKSGFVKVENARKLLRELCSTIEELRVQKKEDDDLKSILWEDVLNRSESWTVFGGENPVIVVEVERLIFNDLVSEVSGEFSGEFR